jgi:hypothetical protein
MYFLNCWSLYNREHEMQMWQQYAKDGVAVQTTFGRLQEVARQFPDEIHMGKVRYGDEDMTRYNLLQFLFTKGTKFTWESEVRIALCSRDPKGGQARNYRETNFPHREPQDDLNPMHPWVHECKRRRFVLKELVTGIAISPWATESVINEVKRDWANLGENNIPVAPHVSSSLVPSPEEFAKYGVMHNGVRTDPAFGDRLPRDEAAIRNARQAVHRGFGFRTGGDNRGPRHRPATNGRWPRSSCRMAAT